MNTFQHFWGVKYLHIKRFLPKYEYKAYLQLKLDTIQRQSRCQDRIPHKLLILHHL